jgi:hypothetical protein
VTITNVEGSLSKMEANGCVLCAREHRELERTHELDNVNASGKHQETKTKLR